MKRGRFLHGPGRVGRVYKVSLLGEVVWVEGRSQGPKKGLWGVSDNLDTSRPFLKRT
jgi:hypothetical protein